MIHRPVVTDEIDAEDAEDAARAPSCAAGSPASEPFGVHGLP